MVATLERVTDSTVTYAPHGASRELFKHHEPEVVISGPAGTGKTYGALWRLHLAALKYPGMRGIMLRKVQEDLTASALVTYQERVLGAGNFGVRAFGGSKLVPAGFQYPNGSMLLIGGLDKPDKVMSREYDLIYVNEAWETTEDDWEKLTTRARWGVMPYQQVFGDTNPQGEGHWMYERFLAGRLTMLFSKHEDNPVLWDARAERWTPAGEDYLAKLGNLTGFRRDRLLLGLWTAAEGVVYPAFNRQTHVKTVNCEGWATALGMDVGTRNPTVVLTARYSGDRLHIEHEHYQAGMSSDAITDVAVDRYKATRATKLTIDPSAAGLISSLTARGIKASKADNDILIGISRVTSILESFTIDPSCVNTIREFGLYRYPGGRRSSTDVPVKEDDHAMDALRYLVLDLYGRPRPKAKPAQGMTQASRW